jgi:hypothetical protein
MHTRRSILVVAGLFFLLWQLLQTVRQQRKKRLYVKIGDNGSVKIGTCKHCVVREKGRPTRSWNNNGDAELDFPRDRLIQRLTEFGLSVEVEQEYVCP